MSVTLKHAKWVFAGGLAAALLAVGALFTGFAFQGNSAQSLDDAAPSPATPQTAAVFETVPQWVVERLGLVVLTPTPADKARAVSRERAIAAAARAFGDYPVEEAVLVSARSGNAGPQGLSAGRLWIVSFQKTPVFGAIGPQDASVTPWTGRTADLVLVDAITGTAIGEFST